MKDRRKLKFVYENNQEAREKINYVLKQRNFKGKNFKKIMKLLIIHTIFNGIGGYDIRVVIDKIYKEEMQRLSLDYEKKQDG